MQVHASQGKLNTTRKLALTYVNLRVRLARALDGLFRFRSIAQTKFYSCNFEDKYLKHAICRNAIMTIKTMNLCKIGQHPVQSPSFLFLLLFVISRLKFFTVWPPNSSPHKSITSHLCLRSELYDFWTLWLMNLRADLRIRLVTHRKSVRKFWFCKLASTCDCPEL